MARTRTKIRIRAINKKYALIVGVYHYDSYDTLEEAKAKIKENNFKQCSICVIRGMV